MAPGEKRLCDLCLASFPKAELTRAGERYLCDACARLQGVESRSMPRVVVRRVGADEGQDEPRRAGPRAPRPYVPRLEPKPRATSCEVSMPGLYDLVELEPEEARPPVDAAPGNVFEPDKPGKGATSEGGRSAPKDLQALGAEIVRCLGDNDLAAFERLFVREPELRAIVGTEAAKAHAQLVQSRIARDFQSKRKLYARSAGELVFERAEAGRAVRTSGDVVELRDVEIRFRIGSIERKLLIQRLFRIGDRYRLEFFE